jgi:hypothetical protein
MIKKIPSPKIAKNCRFLSMPKSNINLDFKKNAIFSLKSPKIVTITMKQEPEVTIAGTTCSDTRRTLKPGSHKQQKMDPFFTSVRFFISLKKLDVEVGRA